MSVSSHLTPHPEPRLWIIHENMRRAVEWTDIKLGALMVFTAAQMALIKILVPEGLPASLALMTLSAILPIGLAALSPLIEAQRPFPLIDAPMSKRHADDSMLTPADIARYPQVELVLRLERYLGGGITATPYYEDIVGQIVTSARVATRKRRLLLFSCVLAGLVQLGVIWQLAR